MLKSTYIPPPPLPPGWTEHKASSGHLYYYNSETKQSTYTRPVPPPVIHASTHESPQGLYPPSSIPPFSATPWDPAVLSSTDAYPSADPYGQWHGRSHDGKDCQPPRKPEDRPKSKHAIPSCEPWLLVKTKLGRRFVHNPETNESYWKFPQDVLKGVVEFDRRERERREREERGDLSETEAVPEEGSKCIIEPGSEQITADWKSEVREDSDEYEEVEITEDEEEEQKNAKRPRTEGGELEAQPLEFNENDIAYQLATMGEEYDEPTITGYEEGTGYLPQTEDEATALFHDLLDDYQISPYMTWERIIEEGRIIEDSRYTLLPNMKSRREAWSNWSRDFIQELKERKEKQEKSDPKIQYLGFLQQHATPKLYWPEFKRKFRREPEMKHTHISDKDREKFYRDHIIRLKLPESTKKSDLSSLLKSVPLHSLNRSSSIEALPPVILTDLRFITLPPEVRDALVEAYISTLPDAPAPVNLSPKEQGERQRKKVERGKREKALTEREKHVQEEKRRQESDLMRSRSMLRRGEAEIERAMRVSREGLKSYMELEQSDCLKEPGKGES